MEICRMADMESQFWDLLLKEYCKKVIYLLSCFWEAIVYVNVDITWLVNVRNHLDKIEKEQAKIKRKSLASLSRNSNLKRIVLERFDEHLPHFQFKSDFLSYCDFLCP